MMSFNGDPNTLSYLQQVALAIHYKCDPRAHFVILKTYIDESATHKGEDFMLMTAYAAGFEAWGHIAEP